MKQLVIDILMKLARMDVDTKELTAQVEAQSLVLAALLLTVGKEDSPSIAENIQNAILTVSRGGEGFLQTDVDLLLTHVNRLLAVTRYVDEATPAEDA
ncbi:anti-adapter protein IraP [Erwinia pyrifoliae]|uniref:Anti-adapter protein IraP n=1 Tax=Erwinia pyrifoliae TaxID=79967 RepID=A0ABY5X5I0_ERWPY|nr:anti-adapter protein IraP [Erwinia pyrifoliae]AUX71871.1 anti-adapter protein IraP [Erwinia pyrifoliae]MCA8877893.1 anti-adapter protein IraP [Erwinia pyrifoliae]MCT2388100.1 anti-adapter protein IraP [Erwinia pyrifoliae]MCU8586270.1 anti-adapter protein IraP [Erwinia pyrifoliae]UWS30179.1 anti-adapter protein IraP [Erwinia pyrifoliae]